MYNCYFFDRLIINAKRKISAFTSEQQHSTRSVSFLFSGLAEIEFLRDREKERDSSRAFSAHNGSLRVRARDRCPRVSRTRTGFPRAGRQKGVRLQRSAGKAVINSDSPLSPSLSMFFSLSCRDRPRTYIHNVVEKGKSRSRGFECHGRWEDRHCPPFLPASSCPPSIFLRSLVCLCHFSRCLSFPVFLSLSLTLAYSPCLYTRMCTVRFIQMRESVGRFEMLAVPPPPPRFLSYSCVSSRLVSPPLPSPLVSSSLYRNLANLVSLPSSVANERTRSVNAR